MTDRTYPLNREKLREEYEELVLKIALAKYMERKSDEAGEWLKEMPEPPCRIDFEKVLAHEQSKEKRHKTMGRVLHVAGKVVTKAAVVFLVLALSFTTAFAASPEIRKAVFKLAYTQYDEYTEIYLPEEEAPEFIDADKYTAEHCYGLTYLPEGWKLTEIDEDDFRIRTTYMKGEEFLYFIQIPPDISWGGNFDSENAKEFGTVQIGNSEGVYCVNSRNITMILWQNNNWHFNITTTCNSDEAIKIARGITRIC